MEKIKSFLTGKMLLLSMAFAFCMYSCTKMDHYYKDLVKLGDRVTVGRVDTAWVHSGNGRVQVGWVNPTDPTAKYLAVYWNNNRDSVVTEIDRSVDTNYLVIEGFDEDTYTLNIYTLDDKGNRSVPTERSVEVFGSIFQESVFNRTISHVVFFKDSAVILWEEVVSETMSHTVVEYVDKNGVTRRAVVPKDAKQISIYNEDATKDIAYKSFFLPEPSAIDTFSTDFQQADLIDLQRHSLTLIAVGSSTVEFIDLAMVTVHDLGYAITYPEKMDIAHLRGSSSKQNLISITHDAGFAAFTAALRDEVVDFAIRNNTEMINLGGKAASHDLYNSLNETDRATMKAAFDEAATKSSPTGRLTQLATGDIVLLRSLARDLYAAIKVVESHNDGNLIIELKVSRY